MPVLQPKPHEVNAFSPPVMNKGYAFVEFATEAEAKHALNQEHEMDGRVVCLTLMFMNDVPVSLGAKPSFTS